MKNLITVLIIFGTFFNLSAQNFGDTIVVQAFNYNSTTRDTAIQFPNDPSLSFEKIVMRYAMRCKDGLVSPNISGQTNIGCGAWDYSCNTYVHDSLQADSVLRTVDQYYVFPDSVSNYTFSNVPTYEIHRTSKTNTSNYTIISETSYAVGSSNNNNSVLLNSDNQGGKLVFLLTISELSSSGITAGDINALSILNTGSDALLQDFKIKMTHSSLSDLSSVSSGLFAGYQNVYHHNFSFITGTNRVQFHTPFLWNGSDNILIEISYKGTLGNGQIAIPTSNSTTIQTIYSNQDIAYQFVPGSYIESDGYLGISGNNSRTIEAWIKTETGGKEIVSWGTNETSAKMAFRTTGDGRLRLEVSGGGIEGSTSLTDGNWHHVALVFNGSTLNNTSFFVDGNIDAKSNSSTVSVSTILSQPILISKGFHDRFWTGEIDDIRIWETALNQSTIQGWMYKSIDNTHPEYNVLGLYYNGEVTNGTVPDYSANNINGTFEYLPINYKIFGNDHFKEFKSLYETPVIDLIQGSYTQNNVVEIINDTTFYAPIQVIENSILSHTGTLMSDEVIPTFYEVYPKNILVYDENGTLIQTTSSSNLNSYTMNTLEYYERNPMRMEIMSFVTPYGINLDLGIDGKAWYFDVTDFYPNLVGERRITMEKGGEWQEDIDIQFLFIIGTPPRNIISNQQIWKVEQASYSDIIADNKFEPRNIPISNDAESFKIRTSITGHGQEGEFIARTHQNIVNGNTLDYQVWKECSENPVFPQGGTWIYDRAGWCPGMPTDIVEQDITTYVGSNNLVNIDYNIVTASGTSNYIVNQQLVTYGPVNHNLDAKVSQIISPNNLVAFSRINPACMNPIIKIQNTGSSVLTSTIIEYSVNGNPNKAQFEWTGNLSFLEETEVSLPINPATFWYDLNSTTNVFEVNLISVNNNTDQYIYNNSSETQFISTEVIANELILEFKTNNAALENSYNVSDINGNILFQKQGLTNSTTYKDTITLTGGCYRINLFDSGDDGISFWANNDGTGSFQIKNLSGNIIKTINPDFGGDIFYEFSTEFTSGIDENKGLGSVIVYPNPANEKIYLETTDLSHGSWQIFSSTGQLMKSGMFNDQYLDSTEINISEFDSGIYFINCINIKNQLTTSFIKQ